MTDLTDFQRKISSALPHIQMRFQEPLSAHTSFRIGGPAEVMAFPEDAAQLGQLLEQSALLDVTAAILGAGTNILAPDAGIPGLVICLKELSQIKQLDETHIQADAGVTMTRLAVFAAGLGLSGLEFAHGIPGSVGGGVYMNAGAYGGEIKDVCNSVQVLTADGCLQTYSADEMDFSYRHSRLEEEQGIVVSAVFELTPKAPEDIRSRMQELAAKRKASQPLDKPSAGSAFKRPVGGYAAALIEQAGLKGYQVGGAAVSDKHSGFVVNLGGATAQEVKDLLKQVSDRVFAQTGIRLEPEVRIW